MVKAEKYRIQQNPKKLYMSYDLEHLKITDEIRGLMARYVRHMDNKEWEKLVSLFTIEASFTLLDVLGEALAVMTGRDHIAKTIAGFVGRATVIHHLFSYEIDVISMAEAKGVFAMEDYLIRPGDEYVELLPETKIPAFRTLNGYGHYHGNYINSNGIWYISKLVQTRLKLDFTY